MCLIADNFFQGVKMVECYRIMNHGMLCRPIGGRAKLSNTGAYWRQVEKSRELVVLAFAPYPPGHVMDVRQRAIQQDHGAHIKQVQGYFSHIGYQYRDGVYYHPAYEPWRKDAAA
jgi:hypothetical protein